MKRKRLSACFSGRSAHPAIQYLGDIHFMVAAVRFPVPLRIYAFIDEQALVDHGGVQLAALQRQPRLLESHVAQFRRARESAPPRLPYRSDDPISSRRYDEASLSPCPRKKEQRGARFPLRKLVGITLGAHENERDGPVPQKAGSAPRRGHRIELFRGPPAVASLHSFPPDQLDEILGQTGRIDRFPYASAYSVSIRLPLPVTCSMSSRKTSVLPNEPAMYFSAVSR